MLTADTDTPTDASTELRLRIVRHLQELEAAEQAFRCWQAEWKRREQRLERQLHEIEEELSRVSGPVRPRLRLFAASCD